MRGVYQHALSFIKDRKPSLEKNFVKSIGFGVSRYDCHSYCVLTDTIPQMGLEFRDSAYLLSPKNSRHLKENMVVNLALGFSDLQDDNGKTYVYFLGTSSVTHLRHLDTHFTSPIPSKWAMKRVFS